MEEIWKDIPNYEGLYQVSNLGRVRSLGNGKSNASKEKILKPGTCGSGYLYIWLYKNGNAQSYKIHRLVLTAFNPVENMKQLDVDHINTVRTDDRLENLRWCTRKENCNNPLSKIHLSEANKGENNPMYGKHHKEESKKKQSEAKKGKYNGENNPMYGKHGVKNPNSIPVVQLTLDEKLVNVYDSAKEAGRVGFSQQNINKCIKGKRKTHGGYKWQYLYNYLLLKHPKITKLNLFNKQYNREEVK